MNATGKLRSVRAHRLCLALGAFLVFALVLAVYRPILPGSFVIDDHRLIGSDNPLVNGELTPRNIWFQTDFTLTTVAWWVERMIFGENPAGYHVVNMALHALGAILLWRLLARLKIPGAWLAAAIFAVHPVCVNTVARVSELKNTLSLPFFLLSFIGYLHYETLALYPAGPKAAGQPHVSGRAALWYGVSLIAFILSLLSKTSTVMLPLVLLVCAAWQRGRISRRDVVHISPFFVLAAAFGLMSVWFQKHQALASATAMLRPTSLPERLAVAGHIPWFYLGKALWPLHLNLYYPQWKVDATAPAAYVPGLLFCAVLVLCWFLRRGWGRHALFGLGCFVVMLFPVLGFFDSQFLTMWQVSDHLQYKPLMAVVALAAAGLASVLSKNTFRFACIVLLSALSVRAFHHAQLFSTEEILLRDTISKNPDAWPVQNDLGVILAKKKDYAEAIEHFTTSLNSNPVNPSAHSNLGHVLTLQGKFDEAETHFRAALKDKPDDPDAHANYAALLAGQGRVREAILHLRAAILFEHKYNPAIESRIQLAALLYQTGDARQAVALFRQALSFKPDQAEALNNLAWILATCSDDQVRNGIEAVRCAERACQLTAFKQAGMVGTLAAAYAEAGRFPEAITNAELAVKLATAAGNIQFAAVNQQLLTLYQAGKPWHTPPAADGSR